ncbi:phage tail tape measure protein [Xenorhabdus bovienii]|uniref:phage tail tape measure protein n=1 Tax=Xenorhabdus bovienii TaxID=40576 RepID=UPI0023B28F39|nr:phage tail tape measure protein [Xenorhabdus bovienii]
MAAGAGSLYGMSRLMTPGLDFDEGMSTVQALTRMDKDSSQLKMLREQARQLGASTAYTATDAAAGQKFLAMAGFTPESVKSALPGVLNMGLAGDVDLGEAADIGSNVLTQFNLDADQMNRVSDVLTATFTRSNTDLRQLGETMTYAGPIASEVGVSLESMAAMAGLMADNGIRGSMAGTALRAGLSRMVAPTGTGADAMAELGVKVKKANGELRGADDILKDMAISLRKYDQASQIWIKKDIFGEEAMVGMGAVLKGTANGKYDEKKSANDNAEGEAGKNAKTKIDNLKGDIKQLKSAWEDLGIQMEESVDSPLRSLTQKITGVLGKIGAWMKANPQLTAALAKGAITIAVIVTALGALALAAAAVIVPFAAFRLSLFMLTRGGGLTALFPALGGLSTRLRGLLPSLGGVSRSVTGWVPIFNNARTAISGLVSRGIAALMKGADFAKRGLLMVFTRPMTAITMLGNGIKGLATGGLGALRIAFQAALSVIGGGLSLLFSPLGLLIAVIVVAALLIWKYWEPIKAWFSGFFSGLMEEIAPDSVHDDGL